MTQAKAWVSDLWVSSFLAICNAKPGKGESRLLWHPLKPSCLPESTLQIIPLNGITPALLAVTNISGHSPANLVGQVALWIFFYFGCSPM